MITDLQALSQQFTNMVWPHNVREWAAAFRKLREEHPLAYEDFELSLLTLSLALKVVQAEAEGKSDE